MGYSPFTPTSHSLVASTHSPPLRNDAAHNRAAAGPVLAEALVDAPEHLVSFIDHHELEGIRGPQERRAPFTAGELAMNEKDPIAAQGVGICFDLARIDSEKVEEFRLPLPEERLG